MEMENGNGNAEGNPEWSKGGRMDGRNAWTDG